MNLKTKPLTKGELAPWYGCRNIKGMGQFKIKQHKPRMESNPTELDSSDFGHYFIGCFHEHFYIFKKLTKTQYLYSLEKVLFAFSVQNVVKISVTFCKVLLAQSQQ